MIAQIQLNIDKELKNFINTTNKCYKLNSISPLLYQSIKNFILRKGKRLRPALFIIGYLGYTKKPASNMYTSAISLELLHDFMLVHDDIIDKSDTRRGKPSMHKMLNNHLRNYTKIKFNGQDLAITIGDVLYAMAINAFLSIKENMDRKETALKKFIESAIYTGSGEFIELLLSVKNIDKIKKQEIYRIYDFKTAHYSFASPLATGAILAGADKKQIDILLKYGTFLGRAFQIKDDILGIFGNEKQIGKSVFTDLQESKKTILIWYAYKNSSRENKKYIKHIMSKEKISIADLEKIRKIIINTKALYLAKKEIGFLIRSAQNSYKQLKMKEKYKTFLNNYSLDLLRL